MRHAQEAKQAEPRLRAPQALLRNLCRELIEHERIKTSQAKAKAVKPEVEKLITLAKRGDLHARRQALSELGQDKFVVHKLFEEVAPRYAERPGRLHADRQARPAPLGLDRDGLPRAGLSTYRLEITYDGRPFSGLGRADGPAHGAGRDRGAFEQILGEPVTAHRRRPHRRRRARLGPGRQLRL